MDQKENALSTNEVGEQDEKHDNEIEQEDFFSDDEKHSHVLYLKLRWPNWTLHHARSKIDISMKIVLLKKDLSIKRDLEGSGTFCCASSG